MRARDYIFQAMMLGVVLLAGSWIVQAQVAWSDDSIQITVTGSGAQAPRFGVHPSGTDCLDLLDDDGPPPPPTQLTKAYFQLDPTCGGSIGDRRIMLEEIRADVQCGQTREWELHIEDTGDAVEVDLEWAASPIDPLPACINHLWLRQWPASFDGGSGMWILDRSGIPLGEVDMLVVSTYSYDKPGAFSHAGFTITLETSVPQSSPDAVDDSASTDEDSPVTVDVLANDSDPNLGDVLTVTGVTDPPHGAVTNSGTSVTYTPDPDYCGEDAFTYTISDGAGGEDTATVTIVVACLPDPPDVIDDTATVEEDSADNPIAVLANDGDPDDGDTLTLISVAQGSHGATAIDGDDVLYTPDADYSGSDTFTYTVEDSTGRTGTAAVTVTVNAFPDPPVAVDDAFTILMDSGLNVLDVLSNDTDPDSGDTLTIQSIGPPPPPDGCPTIINAGDHIKYAPCPGFSGEVILDYIVEDSAGLTATATVTIEVLDIPPVLFFDDFEAPRGWASTGQWHLQDEEVCCPPSMPLETPAWGFGHNGFFASNGLLTSPPIAVLGYEAVDVTFWYCFDVSRAYGLGLSLEADLGNGWVEIADDVLAVAGGWTRFGPVTIPIPGGAAEMRLRFNLRSRFGWGCISIDNVLVTPVGAIQNEDPIADAGDPQAPFVRSVVDLDGSESYDPDGDTLTFDWCFTAAPDGVPYPELIGSDTATPEFTPTEEGIYVLELTVDDGRGGSDSDTVSIDVQPLGDLLFYDNMESGINGWTVQGAWALVDVPEPGAAPESGTHAWQFGNGLISGTGSLTSVPIDISGQAAVSIQFSHFLNIEPYAWFSPAGTRGTLQVLFNDGSDWQTVRSWQHDDPDQDEWLTVAPLMVDVPAGATLIRVRFTFFSRLCVGGWWIDDVRVMAGGAATAMGYLAGPATAASQEGLQVYSMQNIPNPVRDVHTTRFEAQGVGIEDIKVQIFDLSGRLVFDSGWQPNEFEWHLDSAEGDTLANGVYVYVTQVRGVDGNIFICETKKLAVYR